MTEQRFVGVSQEEVKFPGRRYRIDTVKDQTTGVLYALVDGSGGPPTLTPLLDSDGKPIIEK